MIPPEIIIDLEKENYSNNLFKKNGSVLDIDKYPNMAYSDLNLPDNFGFKRKAAPLAALCYLYPKTVVYIPPVNIDYFDLQGIRYKEFIELYDLGYVQPVIGHPKYYQHCDALLELLERKPPSVWGRFDTIAQMYNRDMYVEESKSTLPLSSIANLKTSLMKWQKHFPHLNKTNLLKQIETEWSNIYANLCVIGENQLVSQIVSLKDPELISYYLELANEVLIYSKVMGLGGIPQYDNNYNPTFNLYKDFHKYVHFEVRNVPPDLLWLLKGIDIDVSQSINTKELIRFHENSLSKELWKTHISLLEHISDLNVGDIESKSREYQKLVKELKSITPFIQQKDKKISATIKFCSSALNSLGGIATAFASYDNNWWNAMSLGVAAYQAVEVIGKPIQPIVRKLLLENKIKQHQFYFWELKSKIRK